MQSILLISFEDILHYTAISGNIDVNKIQPHILNSQILYLEPLLGSSLYDKVIDLVDTGNITGSSYSAYQTLLDVYITPSLAFHTVELYIPLNAFQVADGGVQQYQSTNAQTSVLSDIDRLAGKYKVIGSNYDTKLATYLCKNANLFPEYENNTGLIPKTETTNRGCSWYLGTRHTGSKIRI